MKDSGNEEENMLFMICDDGNLEYYFISIDISLLLKWITMCASLTLM